MTPQVTSQTVRQFLDEVAGRQHAMAGAVIALSAAQAVALGAACLQISLRLLGNLLNSDHMARRIEQMNSIKANLVGWCDRDANAIAEFVALRETGQALQGQQMLCAAPSEIGHLTIEAARILEDFRPLAAERVQDDLEMSLALLAGAAQAAMLLLDSNLRIWPDSTLLAQYEPIRANLGKQIRQLTPVARIRE